MKSTVQRLGRATLLFVLTALLAQTTTTAAQTVSHQAVQPAQATPGTAQRMPAPATSGSACYVYPHTFHQDELEYVPGPPPAGHPAVVPLPNPYASIAEIESNYPSSIFNISRDPVTGNFLFLRWNGPDSSGGTATDAKADFTGAGTLGYKYVESREPRNYNLEPGDWLGGSSGNATTLALALDQLINSNTIMLLPLFDQRSGSGPNIEYHATKVAAVRLLSYEFASTNKHFRYALVRRDTQQSCFRNTSRNTVGQTTLFTHTLPLTQGYTFDWTFGDGTSGTGLNTSHAYQTPGTYTVTLTTTHTLSGFPTKGLGRAIIDPAPTVNFSSSSPDQLGQTTSFISTITSSSGPVTPTWDFGDGTSGSGLNPSHIYQATGSYTATLRVVDRNGFVVSHSRSVTVTANFGADCYVYPLSFHQSYLENVPGPGGHPAPQPLPDPNLGWQQIPATYPTSIFTVTRDPVTGSFPMLRWNGTEATGSASQMNEAFSGGGSLGYGFAESRDPRNYLLEAGDWVAGNFGNTSILEGPLTSLRDTNTIMLLPVYDQLEGTGLNSSFHTARFVAVRLVAWNLGGNNKYFKFALARDNASYSCFRSSSPTRIGQTVQFTATMPLTTGLSLNWNFGDGTSASGLNPTHVYAAAGVYTVTLTTTDSSGFVTKAIDTVLITNAPTASFTSSGQLAGQPTQFTSTATGTGPLSYDWDFGDGSAHATTANPAHTYTTAGSYLVRLVVIDASGVSDSEQRTLTIESPVENYNVYLPQLWGN